MKLLTILTSIVVSSSALADPKIEMTASISGAPATEILRALKKPTGTEFQFGSVTTIPGRMAILESIREYRYPTEGGAAPSAFEVRNLGGSLECTASVGANGAITFYGYFTAVRLASEVKPSQGNHLVSASTFLSRESHFTGETRSKETVTIDLGEKGPNFGRLTLTLKLINP